MFISSTFVDLRNEREALLRALQTAGRQPFGMELFLSTPESPRAVAERKIRACDVFALVLGFKAGSLLPGEADSTYTWAEYQLAVRLDKPVFLFIKTRDGRWQNDEAETEKGKRNLLQEFHSSVISRTTPAYFQTPEELALAAVLALGDWEARGRPGARKVFVERSERKKLQQAGSSALFDLHQKLQGRSQILDMLNSFLADPQKVLGVLVGRGGLGKTKLLREWTEAIQGWAVLFLKDRPIWHVDVYKEIPEGRVLLVIDDAHRSEHLQDALALLKEFRSVGRELKMVLAARPSGSDRIREALASRFDTDEFVQWPQLTELSRRETNALAEEMLGDATTRQVAEWLVKISGGNPLTTVVGGRLLALGTIEVQKLETSEQFRTAIFDKFLQELKAEDRFGRALLHLIAATSPIPLNAATFHTRAASFLKFAEHEIASEIKRLEEKGLLASTGSGLRIVPDVLSDFILEDACLDLRGQPLPFVTEVFKHFRDVLLSNLLENLGELEWRVTDGKDRQPLLLREVWETLFREFLQSDAHSRVDLLEAAKGAVVFQPASGLRLVDLALSNPASTEKVFGRFEYGQAEIMAALAPILASIAYHPDYTKRAARILWQLAKQNKKARRTWHDQPAGKVLTELASYRLNRPVWYNEQMLSFVEEIATENSAYEGDFTPLNILSKLLEREGDHTELTGMAVSLSSFGLAYKAIRHIREGALLIVSKLLTGPDPKAAVDAVQILGTVLHGFLPKFGRALTQEEIAWHNDERLKALSIFADSVRTVPVYVKQQILATLRSLTFWGQADTEIVRRAEEVLSSISMTDELFVFDAIATAGWDLDRLGEDFGTTDTRRQQQLENAVGKISVAPGEEQVRILEEMYLQAERHGIELRGGNEFVALLCKDASFLGALASHVLSSHDCPSSFKFLMQVVVCQMRSHDPGRYEQVGIASAHHSNVNVSRGAAAGLFSADLRHGVPQDVRVLRELSAHEDAYVKLNCLNALRFFAKSDQFRDIAIDVALDTEIGSNAKLADELCEIFGEYGVSPTVLTEKRIQSLLSKLLPIGEIDEYHITNLLGWAARERPTLILQFFLDRIRYSLNEHDGSSYQAIPSRSTTIAYMRFAGDGRQIHLEGVRDLLVEAQRGNSYSEQEDLTRLFWIVGALDNTTLSVLDDWLHEQVLERVETVWSLLSHAPGGIALVCPWFTLQVLESAARFGNKHSREVIGRLVANALTTGPQQVSATEIARSPLEDQLSQKVVQFAATEPLAQLYSAILEATRAQAEQMTAMQKEFQKEMES